VICSTVAGMGVHEQLVCVCFCVILCFQDGEVKIFRLRCENNIKIYWHIIEEGRIQLARDMYKWRALVNSVTNLREISWLAEEQLACS